MLASQLIIMHLKWVVVKMTLVNLRSLVSCVKYWHNMSKGV